MKRETRSDGASQAGPHRWHCAARFGAGHAEHDHEGWLENLASEQVADDIFEVLPQSVAMVNVGWADPGAFLGNVRDALGAAAPALSEQVDAARQQVTAILVPLAQSAALLLAGEHRTRRFPSTSINWTSGTRWLATWTHRRRRSGRLAHR